jgi:hypothetical protein
MCQFVDNGPAGTGESLGRTVKKRAGDVLAYFDGSSRFVVNGCCDWLSPRPAKTPHRGLQRRGPVDGWRFRDDPRLTSDWPAEPGRTVRPRDTPADHTFYWFNECGIELDREALGYRIEGTVTFRDVRVLDAGGSELSIENSLADGGQARDTLFAHDNRLSVESQRDPDPGERIRSQCRPEPPRPRPGDGPGRAPGQRL